MMEVIRRRARKPKVRTGCVTCKLRRVKCDEGKPFCLKCSTTGRQCDGYTHDSNRGLISPHSLFVDIQGDEQERRSFSFFRSKTALEIAGYFPSYFWETLILQASHEDPVVLHAVIALGSLHEVYQEAIPGLPENYELSKKREFAIEQSNKSMSLLRTHISTGAPRSGETVLIACLLFTCLETFQGNHESALTHLDSGLKVLQSWLRDEGPNISKEATVTRPSPAFVESSLVPIFARLDIQASTHIMSRPLHCDLVLKSVNVSESLAMPESFSSVCEASDCLVALVYYMFHIQQVAHGYYNTAPECNPYKCPEGLVMMFLIAREQNRRELDVWLEKLNEFLKTSSSNMSMRELRASVLLKVHYLFVAIMLGASGANDETKFDNFTAEFGQMLRLAESLLVPTEQASQKPSFVFDTNMIPPLYLAATRCRDPQLRRTALGLLWSLNSREGIWDSNVAATIGKWVIEKEEEGLVTIDSAQSIPLEKRLTLFGKGTVCGERRVMVRYRRGPAKLGDVTTEEEYLTWSNEDILKQRLQE
ncbi:hypothetical protein L207DRAFT_459127 [Hyaloscypha variabilis F]|uniref:Zn(2)-C6 fungal-type domain-containing protein n=1 Tax=Hyaloscypha variabilis (strain UAMH 11265 / GT02V1 / F) TaxID=1149755 RepID=A0A2J6RPR7_HYAVF|nr:hypothetical protein L207DRAFT_459127 [Hyaloscypha variabilis F]